MANILRLKEQARGYEDDSQWEAALAIYERLVAEAAPEEIALWNRIGDLRLRLGDRAGALAAYEHAADSYAEHGLLSTAVALYQKILRTAPERTSVFRTLGRLNAAQGFLADARLYILTFAERLQQAGQAAEALAALREFAELAPEDPQIRQALAGQLRLQEPESAVREEPPIPAEASPRVPAEPSAFQEETQVEARPEARLHLPAAVAPPDAALELEPVPREQAPDRVTRVEGLELTHPQRHVRSDGEEESVALGNLELVPVHTHGGDRDLDPAPEEHEEDIGEPLPLLVASDELEGEAVAVAPATEPPPAAWEDGGRGERDPGVRRKPDADRASAHHQRGLALQRRGRWDEAIAEFQAALRHRTSSLPTIQAMGECFAEKGQFSLAVRVLERGLTVAGVEEEELIGIFYWLGRCQQALGRPELARDHLERVLSLDIRFRDAAALLESLDATAGS